MVPRGVRTCLAGGVILYLNPADWIEYLLLCGDDYEPATRALMRHNLRAGDGAVYAGVSFGLHVIEGALAVGPSGRIVGVEPQPGARARATRNLAANGAGGQTTILAKALGASAGRATMAWAPVDNPGAASLFAAGPGFEVELVPLSQVEGELHGAHFRALLLDVEGYELEALRGLRTRPDMIVCELAEPLQSRRGVTLAELAGLLIELGYEPFDVLGRPVGLDGLAELPEHNLCARLPGRGITWP